MYIGFLKGVSNGYGSQGGAEQNKVKPHKHVDRTNSLIMKKHV